MPHSVHLTNFPDPTTLPHAPDLVAEMARVRDICNAGLSIRNTENVRTRQPLASLRIVGEDMERLAPYFSLIQDELNVKEVLVSKDIETFAAYKLQMNFPVLGKRLPEKMKQLIPASKQGQWKRLSNGQVEILGETLLPEECSLLLEPKEKKGSQPLSTHDALVILDLTLTRELYLEGLARDLVRLIQQSRKDAGLDVSDRIALVIETGSADIKEAVTLFATGSDYRIDEQTLATDITLGNATAQQHHFSHDLEGETVVIGFEKSEHLTSHSGQRQHS